MGSNPPCYIPSTVWIGLAVRRRRFWRVFIIYGHGGHLYHVSWISKLRSPIPWRLHMKFELNWPSSFGGAVWKCWGQTDNRQNQPCPTISSLIRLCLGWAKNTYLWPFSPKSLSFDWIFLKLLSDSKVFTWLYDVPLHCFAIDCAT